METRRRDFLLLAGSTLLAGCVGEKEREEEGGDEDVSPAEDLMREHGALNRILIIYDDAAARLDAGKDFPIDRLAQCARIIRNFIEGYHEKLEEEHLFPRFEKAGKLVDLVSVLREQHAAGRKVTATIERLSVKGTLAKTSDRTMLAVMLRGFARMYRPHEAREDTILFPAFRSLVTEKEYDKLGEAFEKREHELLGKDGFEGVVEEIAVIEKMFGLDDLAQFTPKG